MSNSPIITVAIEMFKERTGRTVTALQVELVGGGRGDDGGQVGDEGGQREHAVDHAPRSPCLSS